MKEIEIRYDNELKEYVAIIKENNKVVRVEHHDAEEIEYKYGVNPWAIA